MRNSVLEVCGLWNLLNSVLDVGVRYDNVTLIPLVFHLGLRIGPIQRMGAN